MNSIYLNYFILSNLDDAQIKNNVFLLEELFENTYKGICLKYNIKGKISDIYVRLKIIVQNENIEENFSIKEGIFFLKEMFY